MQTQESALGRMPRHHGLEQILPHTSQGSEPHLDLGLPVSRNKSLLLESLVIAAPGLYCLRKAASHQHHTSCRAQSSCDTEAVFAGLLFLVISPCPCCNWRTAGQAPFGTHGLQLWATYRKHSVSQYHVSCHQNTLWLARIWKPLISVPGQ